MTGDPGAYLATELAWRRNWIPDASGGFVPFEGFARRRRVLVRAVGARRGRRIRRARGILVLALAALLLFEPHVRRLGRGDRGCGRRATCVYLLAVFFPQSSIFRLLVPLSPLWGAVADAALDARGGSACWPLCLVGQWWWIYNMYALGEHVLADSLTRV